MGVVVGAEGQATRGDWMVNGSVEPINTLKRLERLSFGVVKAAGKVRLDDLPLGSLVASGRTSLIELGSAERRTHVQAGSPRRCGRVVV